MQSFHQFIPTRLYFGCGEVKQLGKIALPGTKALIVISAGTSMRRFGYLDKVTEQLTSRGVQYVVFDKILPNPIKEHVMEAAALSRSEGCDFIIGLGGGSSIDSAKSIAVMACNEGDYWDYIGGGSGLGKAPAGGALPIVAITTTAGTGTEIDPWTVITHNQEKIGYGNDSTFPVVSIVDPELMLSVPAKLTAYQGFDSFFHSAEGYIATCATPISELYSLKSIELLYKSLPAAVADGENKEARYDVALANTLGGMVESTSSCTSEHSLEHALSAFHPELPHGAGLIAISIAYFSRFIEACPERLCAMASAMTGEKTTDPNDFIEALAKMQQECGVDQIALSEWGVTPDEFVELARNARATMGGLFTVDRRELSQTDVVAIYEESYR
ncbi:MAG: iron-containing alcohol dehydrogenase [Rikenellaceae bacterium]